MDTKIQNKKRFGAEEQIIDIDNDINIHIIERDGKKTVFFTTYNKVISAEMSFSGDKTTAVLRDYNNVSKGKEVLLFKQEVQEE